MPQSHCQLYAHLVFSTKSRYPFLDEAIRANVHAYLATLLRSMGSQYHRTQSFQEEYIEFLKRYDIAYDERYVWD